jgi:hypothetical protein
MILNLLRLELSAVKFSESKRRYLLFCSRRRFTCNLSEGLIYKQKIIVPFKDVNINILQWSKEKDKTTQRPKEGQTTQRSKEGQTTQRPKEGQTTAHKTM